jgi:hypothetical protein
MCASLTVISCFSLMGGSSLGTIICNLKEVLAVAMRDNVCDQFSFVNKYGGTFGDFLANIRGFLGDLLVPVVTVATDIGASSELLDIVERASVTPLGVPALSFSSKSSS